MRHKINKWTVILAMALVTQTQLALAGQGKSGRSALRGDSSDLSGGNTIAAANAALIADALTAARARIDASRKCQRFFHHQGIETISRTHYSFQDLGPGDVAAQVEGDTVLLNLNPKGRFINPPADFAGLHTATEIRGFYILHELGHELSKFTKFCQDHSVSKRVNQVRHDNNNDLLKQNCY